jgi:hypothetical protein
MNAHINRDLAVALVASCNHAEVSPEEGSPQHADYLRINQLLATVESEVKHEYLGGYLHTIDRIVHRVHRLDDVVAMWDITRARDAAWTNAEALWALRGNESLANRYISTLDRTVGLASRGLLNPADTWVARVGRFFHLCWPSRLGRQRYGLEQLQSPVHLENAAAAAGVATSVTESPSAKVAPQCSAHGILLNALLGIASELNELVQTLAPGVAGPQCTSVAGSGAASRGVEAAGIEPTKHSRRRVRRYGQRGWRDFPALAGGALMWQRGSADATVVAAIEDRF